MAGRLQTTAFGPFTRGVIDEAEASQSLTGAARTLRGFRYTGANLVSVRPGTRIVLTLKDDQGSPANITSVCAIVPFADGCLIVGHSETTDKAYLYRLNASLTTWTSSAGATTTNSTPQPVGVLWTSIPNAPDVCVAEGLGVAYITHTGALDSSTLSFATKSFTDSTRAVATVTSDLDADTTPEDLYFTGCVSFQQHLWAWGFGTGTSAANAYRPEMARFSQPNFATAGGLFRTPDSITIGHRVRSQREAIAGGFVAGQALYLGAPYLVTRVTGYGRSSWFREPLDDSYGFVGAKCGVAAGDTLYYWSPRGPVRIRPGGKPEPLFDAIANVVQSVVNPQSIVAGFDIQTDAVIFTFDTGSGIRTWAAFDTRREVWVGADDDWGLSLRCVGTVAPILTSTAAATLGPSGAPTSASTTLIGSTTATANWTAGDATSPTSVEIRQQGATTWTVATTTGAGVASYTFTGLSASVAYEWRVAHLKDGQYSSYLGPSASTQFTTTASGGGLLPPTGPAVYATDDDGNFLVSFTGHANIHVSWTNSGESGVDTGVEMSTDGVSYSIQQNAPPGSASAIVTVYASGTYYFRMQHLKSGYTSSTYTTPVNLTVSIV